MGPLLVVVDVRETIGAEKAITNDLRNTPSVSEEREDIDETEDPFLTDPVLETRDDILTTVASDAQE
jgi:hypothetical protein